MVNRGFSRFRMLQEHKQQLYLKGAKKAKNIDPETNHQGNTDKNVGATGRDIH